MSWSKRQWRAAVLAVVATGALGACASSEDEAPSEPATSLATPTGDDTEATPESPTPESTAPSAENTLGLLPEAADIGEGFMVGESVDAELSPALREGLSQCGAGIGLVESVPSPVHRQGYVDAQGRILEVRIDFPAEPASDEVYRQVDSGLRACEAREFRLGTTEIEVTIAGGADDEVGDQAFRVAASLTANTDGQRVTQNFYLSQFIRDGVGVQVRALDAVEGTERIRFDTELLIATTAMIDEAIRAASFTVAPSDEALEATPEPLVLPSGSSLKSTFEAELTSYLSEGLGLSEEKVTCVVPVVVGPISDAAMEEWLAARADGEEESAPMVGAMLDIGADSCSDVD